MAAGQAVFEQQRVKILPLFVGDYVAQYQDAFLSEMSDLLKDNKIHYREDVWFGLEQAPAAFSAMLKGDNFGKTLIAVSDNK